MRYVRMWWPGGSVSMLESQKVPRWTERYKGRWREDEKEKIRGMNIREISKRKKRT